MMLLVGLGLVVLAWWAVGAFVSASPRAVLQGLRAALTGLLAMGATVGVGLMVVSGRWGLLVSLVPLLLSVFWPRLRAVWRRRAAPGTGGGGPAASGGASGGNAPGGGAGLGSSTVRTAFLEMILDHATGNIRGVVRAGRFQGRPLESLTLEELSRLRTDIERQDWDSIPVLEAWLDRHGPADWRSSPAGGRAEAEEGYKRGAASSGKMSRAEAFQVLGLAPDPTPEMVREAHRRLMARVHPDHGGSDWLAARLNEARDTLLPP